MCVPAKCRGPELNGKPGPECRCLDGYAGEPAYKSISDRRVPKWKSRYSDNRFFKMGTCTPAECGIPNSIGKGLDCECADKFAGNITWKGSVPHGECVPAACNFPHSNKKPGLECACAYGYKEKVPIIQPSQGESLFGNCDPIPCVGDHSNHEAGPGCRCADGYNGTVTMEADGSVIQADSCVPAKCAVENAIGEMARSAIARMAIRAVSRGRGLMRLELADLHAAPYRTPTGSLAWSASAWMAMMDVFCLILLFVLEQSWLVWLTS